ncbi:MAG TPA: hypothetical protein VGY54_16735, partial [Polyangiaceae bacterium]|nr:hypothetical protein [Polyangiaceae bacterium]
MAGPLAAVAMAAGLEHCHRSPTASGKALPPDARPPSRDEVVEVCAGDRHSCARAADGRVACWGNSEFYFSGQERQLDAPRVVEGLPKAEALRCAGRGACIRTADGKIVCRYGLPVSPDTIELPGPAKDFVLYGSGGCAILEDARLVCWYPHVKVVYPVVWESSTTDAGAGATGFAIASASAHGVCVLRGSMAPMCLEPQFFPVPIGAPPPYPEPRLALEAADDLAGVVELMLFDSSTPVMNSFAEVCGRFADGRVACHGRPVPPAWEGVMATQLLGAGCLRGKDGAVHCAVEADWHRRIPPDATSLAVSADHECAVSAGRAKCWGEASYGQLGDGTRYLHERPVRVSDIGDAVAIAAGQTFACASRREGKLSCWG